MELATEEKDKALHSVSARTRCSSRTGTAATNTEANKMLFRFLLVVVVAFSLLITVLSYLLLLPVVVMVEATRYC